MTQDDTFQQVVRALRSLGVTYALTGSIASNYWGDPRFTHDADILLACSGVSPERFAAAFPKEYYVSVEALRDAMRLHSTANVIDGRAGFKVDLWFVAPGGFSWRALERRRTIRTPEGEVDILTPEDLILSKLLWHKKTGTEQQLRDVLGVMVAQWPALDRPYLERTAEELGVLDLLRPLLAQAESDLA